MSVAWGYLAAGVAVVSFGTYAVPVGLSAVGDGFFFQWVQCIAILFFGFIVHLSLTGSPYPPPGITNVTEILYPNCTIVPYQFEPIAMVGGMLWTIGNITVVPIVQLIGLGLGMLLWGIVNMTVGWMVGTIGIPQWGLQPQTVTTPVLNYVGLGVAISSFFLYFFVKVDKAPTPTAHDNLPLGAVGWFLFSRVP